MTNIIKRAGVSEVEFTSHNRDTGLLFLVRVISRRNKFEYLLEMSEIYDNDLSKVIYKGWVATKKPPNRPRKAAVDTILGTVILLAIASMVGLAFYVSAINQVEETAHFIEVEKFDVTRFSGDATKILADIQIVTDVPYSFTLGGDFAKIILTNSDGTAKEPAEISWIRRGAIISYEGILELNDKLNDLQLVTAEFQSGDVTSGKNSINHLIKLDCAYQQDCKTKMYGGSLLGIGSTPPDSILYGITPPGPPGECTCKVLLGNLEVIILWIEPQNNGGSPITHYIVEYKPTKSSHWSTYNGPIHGTTHMSALIPKEILGTALYDFRVAAANIAGVGEFKEMNKKFVGFFDRDVIVDDLTAMSGNGRVILSWTAPDSDGSPITDYEIHYKYISSNKRIIKQFNDGISTSTSATVTGLENDKDYWFFVKPVNAADNGYYSNIVAATPSS